MKEPNSITMKFQMLNQENRLLVFASIFLAINPKYLGVEEEKLDRGKIFCTQVLLIMLVITFFYLFVLTKLTVTDEDVFKCIGLPAIPLALLIYVTLMSYSKKKILTILLTILLTLTTIICGNWALFGKIKWIDSAKLTGLVIGFSIYFICRRRFNFE